MIAALLGVPMAALVLMGLLHRRPDARSWVALGAAVCCLVLALLLPEQGAAAVPAGGRPPPLGILLRADALSRFFLIMTGAVFTAATAYHAGQERERGEDPGSLVYQLCFPLLLLSLNGLFLTADLFNFYVFFELLAVSSYMLVAMGQHHPLEAAWKYMLLSILGSTLLLAGVAFVYGLCGTLYMDEVRQRLAGEALWLAPFFLFALLLKGSLFPFHVWQPDAHAAASTPGSMILAGTLINVGVYGLLRLWPLLFGDAYRGWIAALGLASMAFGAVAAWGTRDAKRLLGFSSTSQLGFVLVGIGWGTRPALAAAVFYLGAHALAKSLLFAVTGLLAARRHDTSLASLEGAGNHRPWLRAAYLLGVLSLIGLPPAVGLVGKVMLFQAGIASGAWLWLAGVFAGSLMTLLYAVKAFHHLFWKEPAEEEPPESSLLGKVSLGLLALAVVAAGVAGARPWQWAEAAAGAAGGAAVEAATGEPVGVLERAMAGAADRAAVEATAGVAAGPGLPALSTAGGAGTAILP